MLPFVSPYLLLLLDSFIVNKHNEDIGNCQALIYVYDISFSVIKLTLPTSIDNRDCFSKIFKLPLNTPNLLQYGHPDFY
jgi:hypothetical protein